ncbi:hypothetical protein PAXRUDRAFT_779528 [Paxillus rubicundulus Ve08.2h10]|uniref:Unplaced genomic scaffold scaffold_2383, whole genome shotgun sequence n=1 Tax=Paxillus rubicundulus Ve08.2h10 TaxID=930991 RepID=A0A0D0D0C8_9AGAM|nr:hypothetical protein PAXRUDRAFT_779528 [Paxillus rubicundulus Ve08.2h10]
METLLTSAHRLPPFIPSVLTWTPTCKQKHQLLDRDPESEMECTYQDALHHNMTAECIFVSSASMFCERLSSQLAAQEEKQKNAQKKQGKLVGDGLPRLLTSDKFHNHVVEHKKAIVDEEVVREEQHKQRDEQMEVMAAWKESETAWLEQN